MNLQLTTPTGKSGAHRDAIAHALGQALGRKFSLEEQTDASLIGGAILAIGNDHYDHSLRGALEQLRARLGAPSLPPS